MPKSKKYNKLFKVGNTFWPHPRSTNKRARIYLRKHGRCCRCVVVCVTWFVEYPPVLNYFWIILLEISILIDTVMSSNNMSSDSVKSVSVLYYFFPHRNWWTFLFIHPFFVVVVSIRILFVPVMTNKFHNNSNFSSQVSKLQAM